MTLTVKHFNTWSACLEQELKNEYWEFISRHAQNADILHFSEVHSCTSDVPSDYVNPEEAGHREGPIHIRQYQKLEELLRSTHILYFAPQIKGLHDLDGSYQNVQYGNVTAVALGLTHDTETGMCYRKFNKLNEQDIGGKPASKSIQSVFVLKEGQWYQSIHYHGHWDNRGKIDTKQRFIQAQTVLNFAKQHREKDMCGIWDTAQVILGGDFNITSKCEVLETLRKSNLFGDDSGVVLNHLFKIDDTRTKWYPDNKPHREANFVITNYEERFLGFGIDQTAPSDHAMITTVLQ